MPSRRLLNLSLIFGVVSTLAYLGLVGSGQRGHHLLLLRCRVDGGECRDIEPGRRGLPEARRGLHFRRADVGHQPRDPLSDTIGAVLYEHVFANHLAPLIVVSAAFTAFVLLLVPLVDRQR